MEMFEMNLTCSCVFLFGRNLWCLYGGWRGLLKLEMKIKMMGFSLEKMGIEIGIKKSRNTWLLNFDFVIS